MCVCVCVCVCVRESKKDEGGVKNERERTVGGREAYINQTIQSRTVGVAPHNSLCCQDNLLYTHTTHCTVGHHSSYTNSSSCRIRWEVCEFSLRVESSCLLLITQQTLSGLQSEILSLNQWIFLENDHNT